MKFKSLLTAEEGSLTWASDTKPLSFYDIKIIKYAKWAMGFAFSLQFPCVECFKNLLLCPIKSINAKWIRILYKIKQTRKPLFKIRSYSTASAMRWVAVLEFPISTRTTALQYCKEVKLRCSALCWAVVGSKQLSVTRTTALQWSMNES